MTTRLGSTAADTVEVVHAGLWLTVVNSSTVTLRSGMLVLRGGTYKHHPVGWAQRDR